MKSKLPWILAVLIAGALMAGCHGTLIVQVLDSPTPTPRVGSTLMPLLPSSATPDTTRMLTSTATPTSIPFPTSTAAPAPPPAPTQAPTSLPTAKSGVVVTTPTPALAPKAAPSESPFEITPGVALQVPRMWHTATRLADGRILLAGGSRAVPDFLADAELFDPTSGQTRQVASLHTPRHEHSATLLPDGRVLVVGGYSLPRQWLDDAEVYDPATDRWTVVPPRTSHAVGHTATRMNDGRVLVVGGNPGSGMDTNRVEIFDPRTNTWSKARALKFNRAGHTAQLLEDGRVLVAGGACSGSVRCPDGDALLYDPQADTWTATGPMVKPLAQSRSVRLPDGRVLVAGGAGSDPTSPPISASAQIYDPATKAWTAAADLAQARFLHELVLLPSGQVLAIGGARVWDTFWTGNSFVREIELYDPARNEWRILGQLPEPRALATATLLPDGYVWLAGGRNDTTFFSDSWLVGP
jgi:hypothetical protein